MAAACRSAALATVLRTVGTCAWRPGVTARGEVSRLIHTSHAAVQLKRVADSGSEKYTETFIKKQIEEFNIGKRHLANMMGEDPETFTQADIDKAIAYLFPSGLFEKKARPLMKHPKDIFPKQLAIQWGEDKRPFHFLFYTGKQEFYSLMHDTQEKFLKVKAYEDEVRLKNLNAESAGQVVMAGWNWLSKEELEKEIEKMSDRDYQYFIQTMERLVKLPHSSIEEEYVYKFCRKLEIQTKKQIVNPPQYDEHGRAFSTAEGKRKTSHATVILKDNGKGNIIINGEDYLDFFTVLQDREQLMFPFQFVDRFRTYDTECTVSEGGRSSQAGAIRLAISKAMLSFVSETQVEAMRQAGLLTEDPRTRERKKPGQEGARRKFTWKKR